MRDYVDITRSTSRRRRVATNVSIIKDTATAVNMNDTERDRAPRRPAAEYDHFDGNWTVGGVDTSTTPGISRVEVGIVREGNATGQRPIRITRNTTFVVSQSAYPNSSATALMQVSTTIECAIGDEIGIEVLQTSGGSLNVLQSIETFRAITLVKPTG